MDCRYRIFARDAPLGCDLLVHPSQQQLLLGHRLVRGRSGNSV